MIEIDELRRIVVMNKLKGSATRIFSEGGDSYVLVRFSKMHPKHMIIKKEEPNDRPYNPESLAYVPFVIDTRELRKFSFVK